MSYSVRILGCGSSAGVPRIGGDWGVCDPTNPKNRRRRCSVLISRKASDGTTQVLVDTSPDLREQLLDAGTGVLDGVVFTHSHADHCHGIDELRTVYFNTRKRVPAYMDARTSAKITTAFDYCFMTPVGSNYPPIVEERRIHALEPFEVAGPGGAVPFTAFDLEHGEVRALGLRVGDMAYTPDVKDVPLESLEALEGLDLWIIDALRRTPHPSHFNLTETLEWLARMKPKRAVITNMHVDLDYETLRRELPENAVPAYDGMTIEFT